MVSRTLIRPPESRMGPITDAERRETLAASPLAGKYDTPVNRESAQELLAKRADAAAAQAKMAEDMLNAGPVPPDAAATTSARARRYEPAQRAPRASAAAVPRRRDHPDGGQAARHPAGAAAGAGDSGELVQGTVNWTR